MRAPEEPQPGEGGGRLAAWSLRLRRALKDRRTPLARLGYRMIMAVRRFEVPLLRPVHVPLYYLSRAVSDIVGSLVAAVWWIPLFKARLATPAPGLQLEGGGLPLVTGPLTLRVGRDCRISTATTFSGRSAGARVPVFDIGDRVFIGWQTTVAVGSRIAIGDNVLIAGRALLAGYPGHPLDPADRARGLPDTPDQVGDIIIEDDVWLATGVTVTAGVRIGRGTVVAAGSIVTRDLPSFVLAAGAPARVIRTLPGGGRGAVADADADADADAEVPARRAGAHG